MPSSPKMTVGQICCIEDHRFLELNALRLTGPCDAEMITSGCIVKKCPAMRVLKSFGSEDMTDKDVNSE